MKNRFNYIACLVLALLPLTLVGQLQRPIISQYMFNGQVLNPAFVGTINETSFMASHRVQWVNIDGAPTLQTFSFQTPAADNRIGIGAMMTRDKIGVHEDYGFYGMYSYKVRLPYGILSMGIQGGFNNIVSDFDQLNLRHPDDPFLSGRMVDFKPNFGTGLFLSNTKMFAGISVPYMLKNRVHDLRDFGAEARGARYYYLTGGYYHAISEKLTLVPSALIRVEETSPLAFDLNLMLIMDQRVYAGVSYRSGESISFVGQIIANENFRFGYSYDYLTSTLQNFSPGSHEFILNYRIEMKHFKKEPYCNSYL